MLRRVGWRRCCFHDRLLALPKRSACLSGSRCRPASASWRGMGPGAGLRHSAETSLARERQHRLVFVCHRLPHAFVCASSHESRSFGHDGGLRWLDCETPPNLLAVRRGLTDQPKLIFMSAIQLREKGSDDRPDPGFGSDRQGWRGSFFTSAATSGWASLKFITHGLAVSASGGSSTGFTVRGAASTVAGAQARESLLAVEASTPSRSWISV